MKSDPDILSIRDLEARSTFQWDGVRNFEVSHATAPRGIITILTSTSVRSVNGRFGGWLMSYLEHLERKALGVNRERKNEFPTRTLLGYHGGNMSSHHKPVHSRVSRTRAAGGVVVGPKGCILIVNQHGDSWSLPKGHVNPGESLLDAAKREIEEESGIPRDSLHLVSELGTYERNRIGKYGKGEDPSELKAITLFLFCTDIDVLSPKDPDNPEARWVDREAVADMLTHPKDRAFFVGALASGSLDTM